MKKITITYNGTYYFLSGDDAQFLCDEQTMLQIVANLLPAYENDEKSED